LLHHHVEQRRRRDDGLPEFWSGWILGAGFLRRFTHRAVSSHPAFLGVLIGSLSGRVQTSSERRSTLSGPAWQTAGMFRKSKLFPPYSITELDLKGK